ncbi:hypothetical protein [Helcococcus ovis]|uniref:hypothetical protein n=1 Tax=Helcococcus ovis TaxID=72026 RepID=UPI0038BAC4C0
MKNILFIIPVLILIIYLIYYIQKQLSRNNNKYLGLILPSLFFINSIIAILKMAIYTSNDIKNNGFGITVYVQPNLLGITIQIISALIFFNIPSIILYLIYINERSKINKKSDINKMKINDL